MTDTAGSDVVVSPVIVVSQTFDARPGSLPEAHAFVRDALAGATMESADLRAIHTAIIDAMLKAASPSIGKFQVVIRLFPDDVEVEVLSSADRAGPVSEVPGEPTSFADWFADVLRRQGLSQEAAARQLGVSVRTVSRWVRGTTEPRLRDVRRISEAFGPVPHR
ncbi:MAG TPA: helix-turn-helix transcriptional regulator [Jatrophihabitantaceae bacterium]